MHLVRPTELLAGLGYTANASPRALDRERERERERGREGETDNKVNTPTKAQKERDIERERADLEGMQRLNVHENKSSFLISDIHKTRFLSHPGAIFKLFIGATLKMRIVNLFTVFRLADDEL